MMDRPLLKGDIGATNSALSGFILMAAKAAYSGQASTEDRHQGEAIIKELLAAAKECGYTKGQILETRLLIGFTRRTVEMCYELCECISAQAWLHAMFRAGFYVERY